LISDTIWKATDERKQIKKQLSQGQPMTKIHNELKCEYKAKNEEAKRRCAKDKQHRFDSKTSKAWYTVNKFCLR